MWSGGSAGAGPGGRELHFILAPAGTSHTFTLANM